MIATRGATAYSQMEHYQTPPLTESIRYVDDPDRANERAWAGLIDNLLALRGLTDDWDGQGAEAPHPALVDSAIRLAQRLFGGRVTPANRILAGVNGTILFEWFSPTMYTEIEVTAPRRIEVREMAKGSETAKAYSVTEWTA